jgi:hypothetical protein
MTSQQCSFVEEHAKMTYSPQPNAKEVRENLTLGPVTELAVMAPGRRGRGGRNLRLGLSPATAGRSSRTYGTGWEGRERLDSSGGAGQKSPAGVGPTGPPPLGGECLAPAHPRGTVAHGEDGGEGSWPCLCSGCWSERFAEKTNFWLQTVSEPRLRSSSP